MKRLMFGTIAGVILVPVGLIALYTAPAVAHDHVIKERIDLMRKGGLGNFKVIKAFVTDSKGAMADGCDFLLRAVRRAGMRTNRMNGRDGPISHARWPISESAVR